MSVIQKITTKTTLNKRDHYEFKRSSIMEVQVRKGLIASIYEDSSRSITKVSEQEAKAIAYLFKHKKCLFKKSYNSYKLKMLDRDYIIILKYCPPL